MIRRLRTGRCERVHSCISSSTVMIKFSKYDRPMLGAAPSIGLGSADCGGVDIAITSFSANSGVRYVDAGEANSAERDAEELEERFPESALSVRMRRTVGRLVGDPNETHWVLIVSFVTPFNAERVGLDGIWTGRGGSGAVGGAGAGLRTSPRRVLLNFI